MHGGRVDPDEVILTNGDTHGDRQMNLPMDQLYYSRLASNVAVYIQHLELTIIE